MATFEIYKDAGKLYRWRLKADNAEIIATGEAYTTKQGCKGGVASVRSSAPNAAEKDLTGEK